LQTAAAVAASSSGSSISAGPGGTGRVFGQWAKGTTGGGAPAVTGGASNVAGGATGTSGGATSGTGGGSAPKKSDLSKAVQQLVDLASEELRETELQETKHHVFGPEKK